MLAKFAQSCRSFGEGKSIAYARVGTPLIADPGFSLLTGFKLEK